MLLSAYVWRAYPRARAMRFSVILTPEQAGILYDLVEANRATIVGQWAFGVWDGLLYSLAQIAARYCIRTAGK